MLTITVLYNDNFLLTKSKGSYLPNGFVNEEDLETGEIIPDKWRQILTAITPFEISKSRKTATSAKFVRETFKEYFDQNGNGK